MGYFEEDYGGFEPPQDVDPIHFTVIKVVRETEKARLVQTKQGRFWVPKSISNLEEDILTVEGWFNPEYLRPRSAPKAEDEFEVLD